MNRYKRRGVMLLGILFSVAIMFHILFMNFGLPVKTSRTISPHDTANNPADEYQIVQAPDDDKTHLTVPPDITEQTKHSVNQSSTASSIESNVSGRSYSHALKQHASKDGEILLSLIDSGVIPMAVNFFLTSIKPLGITNYLILTMDPDTCKHLQPYGMNCHQYKDMSKPGDTASRYGSKSFLAKMNVRTDMIIEALASGFTVLHTDVDMLYFKDPFSLKPCPRPGCDMAVLWDAVQYNAGFLFINPTEASKHIYQSMKEFAMKNPAIDDQTQLNLMIKREKGKDVNIIKLPPSQFQCGRYYFEEPKRYFADQLLPCPDCIVVHNNWIVSMEAKVYRARELHQWVYDGHGYYSNKQGKYLTYQNPTPTANYADETDALKSALQIASILNRTLILPRFHQKNQQVPLNSLFRVSDFKKLFEFRESSFLTHPLVPDAVKQSVFGPSLIMTSFVLAQQPSVKNDSTIHRMQPHNATHGMTELEIVRSFGNITQSVLSFHSMYRAFSGFSNEKQNTQWAHKFQQGIKPAGYRQY